MTIYILGFLRNAAGRYDPLSTQINTVEYKALYKYANEARFCLSVAKATLLDGTIVGWRGRVFDYSSKKIVSITGSTRRVNDEITRVKNLPSTASGWVNINRPPKAANNQLFEMEKVDRIQRVGRGLVSKLLVQGISTVKQLKHLPDDAMDRLVASSINRTILTSASTRTNASLPGEYPNPIIDYRQAANPYEQRFGEDHLKQISKWAALSPFVSVQKLVLHIMSETKRIMKGTIHERD